MCYLDFQHRPEVKMSLRLLLKHYQLVVPMGAEGENDPTDDADDSEKDKEDDTADDGGDDSSGDDGKPVSREEFQKLFQRMQAADRAKTAAEAKLREKERADMDETTRAKAELEEAKAERQRLEDELKTERLHNAFLASNTITWHDPELAMSHVDLDGVLKDDGTVDSKALKASIQALAKSKPFLVKTEGENGGGGNGGKNGSTGAGIGTDLGGDKDKNGASKRAALEKKYPALRTGR